MNRVEKVIAQTRHLTKIQIHQFEPRSKFMQRVASTQSKCTSNSKRLFALKITTSFPHMPVTNGSGVFWLVCQFVHHFCFAERFLQITAEYVTKQGVSKESVNISSYEKYFPYVLGLSAYNSNIPHFSHVIKVDYL